MAHPGTGDPRAGRIALPHTSMGLFQGFVYVAKSGRPPETARAVRMKRLPTAPAAATTTESMLRFRTSFVDIQCAAVELGAVEIANGAIAFRIVPHFHKRKSTGLARIAIRHDVHTINGPEWLKNGTNRSFGRTEAQVSNKNVLHEFSFLNLRAANRARPDKVGRTGRCKMVRKSAA